jgi:hypothetical protein
MASIVGAVVGGGDGSWERVGATVGGREVAVMEGTGVSAAGTGAQAVDASNKQETSNVMNH